LRPAEPGKVWLHRMNVAVMVLMLGVLLLHRHLHLLGKSAHT
jgi:hypothetical protein